MPMMSLLVEVPFRLLKPLLQQKQRRLTHAHDVHACVSAFQAAEATAPAEAERAEARGSKLF